MDDKNRNRKEYADGEYLPSNLVDRLTELFNKKSYQYKTINNFLLCTAIIYYHQKSGGYGLNGFVPLGSDYWKTVFKTHNYHKSVLSPLLDYEIIEKHEFGYRTFRSSQKTNSAYKIIGKVVNRYRISPDLMNDEFKRIEYINKSRVFTARETIVFGKQKLVLSDAPELDFMVTIDPKKTNQWIKSNAEDICSDLLKQDYVKGLPEDLKILCREQIENNGKWSADIRYTTVKAAKLTSDFWGKQFFYFNKDFYLADLPAFMEHRITELTFHYKEQVSNLDSIPVIEKRNPKTLRVYSVLTNFPSRILKFVKINNNPLVQLDLRTSQFLLFANVLNVYVTEGKDHLLGLFGQNNNKTYLKRLIKVLDTYRERLPKVGVDVTNSRSGEFGNSDVTMFIRDVFFNDFYKVVQQELGFQDRLLAKHLLFKLLFKRTSRSDVLLDMLKNRYPTVLGIIAEFKEKNKDPESNDINKFNDENNFSVFLQCIEAEIFVDHILKTLREQKIACFTRHDSICVARGYEQQAEDIAKQVFAEFGFRFNPREEDLFWEAVDEDEMENSDLMQWFIDVNELNQEFFIHNTPQDPDETNIDIMNEEHKEILSRLAEIGVRDDYCGIIDAEFLEEIAQLPFMSTKEYNILLDEVNNQRDGMPFFQPETNALIRHTIFRFD